jgi:hypothetical protein
MGRYCKTNTLPKKKTSGLHFECKGKEGRKTARVSGRTAQDMCMHQDARVRRNIYASERA